MLPLPGLDFVEQMCWQEFLDASTRLLAAFDARLRDMHELALLDVLLLDLLATAAIRKPEFADALMQPPDQVALQIRSLQAKGLIGRWPTPYDRRAALVCITPAGRDRVDAARKTYAKEVRTHYLDRMSAQQLIALADNHRRINGPLKELPKRPDATDGISRRCGGSTGLLGAQGLYGPALHGLCGHGRLLVNADEPTRLPTP